MSDDASSSTALVLLAWAEHDAARALHAVDREIVRSTEAARSLVLDLLLVTTGWGGSARDLWSACARLGRLMADGGASPSLAAGTIDCAARALDEAKVSYDASRLGVARSSLLEGFVAAMCDSERVRQNLSWEYPSCVVPLEDGSVAIACGYPTDDAEALADWAARVATRLSKAKVRCVVIAGSDPAKAEIVSAVELLGINVGGAAAQARQPPSERERTTQPPANAPKSSWLRLPWRK